MISLLLAVIYITFISLGLPDSLLGAAWPTMQYSVGVPIHYAGYLSMIIAGGTVISSLLTGKLLKRLGTGPLVVTSVLLTALALLGFSFSDHFLILCLLAIPYGLGAGAIDAALNHYVAVHFAARHMSWLYCFWGVGAAVSPYIMGYFITQNENWQGGYRAVAFLQIGLTVILFCSLPLWKKASTNSEEETQKSSLTMRDVLRKRGALQAMLTFFCYCALESTAGLWASTYLYRERLMLPEFAAKCAALFYIGITAGRFLSGFLTERLGDRLMIRIGLCGIAAGILLILIPLPPRCALAGLIIIGLGCAPIYPCQIHATPELFGKDAAQLLIGMQMASAYIGTTLIPPLFGSFSEHAGIGSYPLFLLFFLILMVLLTEQVHGKNKKTKA